MPDEAYDQVKLDVSHNTTRLNRTHPTQLEGTVYIDRTAKGPASDKGRESRSERRITRPCTGKTRTGRAAARSAGAHRFSAPRTSREGLAGRPTLGTGSPSAGAPRLPSGNPAVRGRHTLSACSR